MTAWKEYRFGELVEFPPKISLKKGEEYPFIDMDAVNPASRYVENKQLKKYDSSGAAKFEDRDVLLARITPCLENGKIAQVKIKKTERGFGSTEFFVFRSQQNLLNQSFLFYLAKSDLIWKNAVNSMVGASGRQRADASFLKKVKLVIPPLGEQQKIAAILSAYDDLIENNKRRIALLEKMAEEIYREWFVRFRFPGYQTAEFEKGIPKGWSYEKLENLCELIKRGISPKYSDETGYLVINQKCIRDERIDLSEARCHDSKVASEKYIRFGDALINSTGVGTLGRVSVVEFHPKQITVDSHVTICRANKDKIDPVYLATTVSKLKNYFEFMAAGSTGQVELNRSLIAGIKIIVPPEELMKDFGSQMSQIFKQKQVLSNMNDNLMRTKDQLLPRLISGKLSVENLDIQFPPSMQAATLAS